MLTHFADRADTPVSSPPALSSIVSMVAMVAAFASRLITVVRKHLADRADALISSLPTPSSVV